MHACRYQRACASLSRVNCGQMMEKVTNEGDDGWLGAERASKLGGDLHHHVQGGLKPTRSFRYEDYNTRRAFLHSYPLQWDWRHHGDNGDDDNGRMGQLGDHHQQEHTAARRKMRKQKKKADYNYCDDHHDHEGRRRHDHHHHHLAVMEWGEGKLLVLRRLKRKLAFYLLACAHYPTLHLPAFMSTSSSSSNNSRCSMLTAR